MLLKIHHFIELKKGGNGYGDGDGGGVHGVYP